MMKGLSSVVVGFAMAMTVGCGGMPEETTDMSVPEQENLGSVEQLANGNGDWCYARCNNGLLYAGPDVTQNCTDWATNVCRNRLTTLADAFWGAPYPTRRADCYLYGDGTCYLVPR
ncbi:hypothetical protein HPC49_42910 [Pyxidicoccus fallax]|uniref:Lipoprotein n=1 Tax=Pyxidicoccus fallax TaxID=394095 RepID=A0A848LXG5_9BACT|nr:hypothetical protein [Pyxidicoccus fallax]NMO22807.1 hypothetical protein [Pyxidicoccus fallax]NPC84957.1 hypothetical protein [Pyxidicoccus fallax]